MPLWYGDTWGDGATPALSGQWAPGVANSWDEVERHRVYNFHLNPDVGWHDGAPLTASDVLFGIEMAFDELQQQQAQDGLGRHLGAKAWGDNPTDSAEDIEGISVIDAIDGPGRARKAGPGLVGRRKQDLPHGASPLRRAGKGDRNRGAGHQLARQRPDDLGALRHPAVRPPVGEQELCLRRAVRGRLRRALRRRRGAEHGHRGQLAPHPIDFHRAAGGADWTFARLAALPHLRPFPQRSPFGSHVFFNQTAEVFADMTLEQQSLLIEAMVRAVDRESMNNELVRRHAVRLGLHLRAHCAAAGPARRAPSATCPTTPTRRARVGGRGQLGLRPRHQVDQMGRAIGHGPGYAQGLLGARSASRPSSCWSSGSAVIEKLYQERVHDMVMANMGGAQHARDACLRVCSDKVYELGGWNHSNINRPWIDEMYAAVFAAERRKRSARSGSSWPPGCTPRATWWPAAVAQTC